ncbi:RNA polymerase sigma factor [Siphonobacter aquaeclarae]|jgi:RNA polymerase sigma factor (sigma-70 family)|uniref:RNA polymerase sigma factor, sigma-70 family n=1 Tax=Siphonobacter aquaeclarae TaxID=563176 RepID=A0A1G9U430_9BACT|nr:sigma-70 family RNA polymerase sigma factor [Siphonobacter aquaeclarae]MBO9639788.1 sigma-70 family RNA polymerase sigma factor [Siphonobacter aquaeclarae]SDM54707.1 RNA polymerase sigma factor, sigma-70 family [Siphonobacter aquaeclarae]
MENFKELIGIQSQEKLLARLRSKDRRELNEAIRDVYSHHISPVRYFVMQNGGNAQDADDLVQITVLNFVQAVRNGSFQLQEGTTIEAFLFVLAKNRWRNTLKQRGLMRDYVQEMESTVADVDFWEASAQRIMEEREDQERYLKLFNLLGERCRFILTAYRRDGLSMKEIARQMGYDNERIAINEKYKCLQKLKALFRYET